MTAHVHRWRIASPDGPTSEGWCACGEHRVFDNNMPERPGFNTKKHPQPILHPVSLAEAARAWRQIIGTEVKG